MELHKTLLASERVRYEKNIAPIPSPNHFLQLLTTDPWFAWLHRLSLLIVTMDEALDSRRHPLTDLDAAALIQTTRQLLVASEDGDDFSTHYFHALQRDPDVVLAHASVVKLFASRQSRN